MQRYVSEMHAGPFEWADPEQEVLTGIGLAARVILFNDEEHTFDEVIGQIIAATGCSYDHAEDLTFEVHSTGKAMVFEGDLPQCLRVSGILEEIALHTQVEC
jgi:hypothetical protein